ncbi:hypothetical protein [Mesobacillus maritimus]|uniref:hypothetical protein n=1 Tax=Mesobacillus maritimus TaxID=1643336 RepID=UPI00384EDB0D
MDKQNSEIQPNQDKFFDLLKKTYEKGNFDKEITVERLLEDLKIDIRKVFTI